MPDLNFQVFARRLSYISAHFKFLEVTPIFSPLKGSELFSLVCFVVKGGAREWVSYPAVPRKAINILIRMKTATVNLVKIKT